jgi:hypothetical protein
MSGFLLWPLFCFLSFNLFKNLKDFPFLMAKAVFMAKAQIVPQPLFVKK